MKQKAKANPKQNPETKDNTLFTQWQLDQLLFRLQGVNPAFKKLPACATMEQRAAHQILTESFHEVTTAIIQIGRGLQASELKSTYGTEKE